MTKTTMTKTQTNNRILPQPSLSSLSLSLSLYNVTRIVEVNDIARVFPFHNDWHGRNGSSSLVAAKWCTESLYDNQSSTTTHRQPRPKRHRQPWGILYNKVPKAASSTLAGVARRIAANQARAHLSPLNVSSSQHPHDHECAVETRHFQQYSVGESYRNRDKEHSFLFTSVRDPSSRAMSRFFFSHWRNQEEGKQPSDEAVISFLSNDRHSQYVMECKVT